jgi:hypothetical protein
MAGKGVSTDGIYLLTDMRRPALSGPENEKGLNMSRQSFRAQITREFGIPSRTLGLSPLGRWDRHPFPVYLQIQHKPILSLAPVLSPFPSRRPSKMDMPRAHSALCVAAKGKCVLRSDLILHTPLSFCYCKGVGWGGLCVCAVVAHTVSCGSHRFEGFGR